jgi:hypothetical protein
MIGTNSYKLSNGNFTVFKRYDDVSMKK